MLLGCLQVGGTVQLVLGYDDELGLEAEEVGNGDSGDQPLCPSRHIIRMVAGMIN